MWKWLAPLLLLTGKPEILLRVVTAVIAAAIVAFGVWLLSNIAVTFDTLKIHISQPPTALSCCCFS